MTILFGEYSRFAQSFIEVWDELTYLDAEVESYTEEMQEVPEDLQNERDSYHETIVNMIAEGWNRWQKTADEMRKEGWEFWMLEDKILRERRYGNK